jgi:hypothetical protein
VRHLAESVGAESEGTVGGPDKAFFGTVVRLRAVQGTQRSVDAIKPTTHLFPGRNDLSPQRSHRALDIRFWFVLPSCLGSSRTNHKPSHGFGRALDAMRVRTISHGRPVVHA